VKAKERKLACRLRSKGWSLRRISAEVKCSKSTASRWIRDIPLTEEQIACLKSNQDIGRARAADHINSSKKKWERIRNQIAESATKEIPNRHSLKELKQIGTALYWAEGYNASRHVFMFANSDPAMIRIMRDFLLKVCKVSSDKLRGRVYIHSHLNAGKAEKYWSKVSDIPLSQFHKTHIATSKASKHKKDSLPLGTFNIIVSGVALCFTMKGWIEGLKRWGG